MMNRPEPTPTGRYAVVIRSPGFIDQFARKAPRQGWDENKLDAYLYPDHSPAEDHTFESKDEAAAHAARLSERFGVGEFNRRPDYYRFQVAEERMVPRWYLAEPKTERERAIAIGSCEQI